MGQINDETRIVVVRDNADGIPEISIAPKAAPIEVPGVVHGGYFWGTDRNPELPGYIGEVPADMAFPGSSGTRLGLFEWGPHSDGKFDVSDALDGTGAENDPEGDVEMHATDTVDYEYIISGKVDIEFPGGNITTLEAGDIVIMGGSAHAWKNRYDEPCRYIAFLVGAKRG